MIRLVSWDDSHTFHRHGGLCSDLFRAAATSVRTWSNRGRKRFRRQEMSRIASSNSCWRGLAKRITRDTPADFIMTDKQTGLTQQQKPSTNKNIRKLRTISMVCGLASSWQQWAADNEKKQTSEPSGWTPASLGGPTEEPRKKWVPKKNPPTQVYPTDGSRPHISSGDASLSSQKSPETVVQQRAEPSIGAAIKVKQVMKTVTSGVQEKGASINLLAEKIKRESLPSEDEIDRILKKKSSPTRRRKCSNMVSSLTKSWKQVENRPGGKDGGQPGERTSRVGSGDHSGDLVDTEESVGEEKASKDDPESELKLKRPTVSM